jgi:hypothetical protein
MANHGKRLRAACELVKSIKTKVLLPGETAFLVAYANYLYGDGVADAFWRGVLSADGIHSGTPQYTLYRKLIDYPKMHRVTRMKHCINAFNAYVQGKMIKVLRDVAGEEFPKFIDPLMIKSERLAALKRGA